MWILESSYWCVWRLKRCGFVVGKPAGGRLWGFKSYPYKTPNLYSLFLFVVWDVSSHLFLLPCFCLAIWILTLWNFNPLINTSVSSVWFFFKKHIFFKKICVYECLFACLYVHQIHAGAHRGQKRARDPLELELKMVVNYHVRYQNQVWVLYKSSKCY